MEEKERVKTKRRKFKLKAKEIKNTKMEAKLVAAHLQLMAGRLGSWTVWLTAFFQKYKMNNLRHPRIS